MELFSSTRIRSLPQRTIYTTGKISSPRRPNFSITGPQMIRLKTHTKHDGLVARKDRRHVS